MLSFPRLISRKLYTIQLVPPPARLTVKRLYVEEMIKFYDVVFFALLTYSDVLTAVKRQGACASAVNFRFIDVISEPAFTPATSVT